MFHPNPAKPPHMIFGTEQDKQQAVDFIRGIRADGGTRHMEALKLAVGMGPDVIFFLTDAEQPILTDVDLAQIRRWNRSGASIHAIEFGAGAYNGGDNFLMKLARENNGRHVYVDVRSLPGVGHSG